MTLFVVTGIGRSGTSMMMQALIAGGMDAEYTPLDGEYIVEKNGYHPNKNGYYQVKKDDMLLPGFPKQFDGKLIKILIDYWDTTEIIPMKVIMMRRGANSIRASRDRVGEHIGKAVTDNEYYIENLDKIRAYLKENSVTYDEVWYERVLEQPLRVFEELRDNGWDIDPEKCAEIPDPTLRHF